MSEATKAIGIDLGGTRIKGVLVDAAGNLLHQFYTPTNDAGDGNWKEAVVQTFRELMQKADGQAVVAGLSAPGIPDETNTRIRIMPGRLQGLEGLHWGDHLGHPCTVVNDAIAALAAEARFGKAKGVRDAVMLTLGTGVGGAVLINGQIHPGMFQKAGHAGHITVDHEGEPDVTGMPGSLEDAIGNCTVEKRSLGRFTSTHDLLEAQRHGDAFATWLWLSSVRKLAVAIASITNLLSPEMVIIGGGITEAGLELLNPLNKFLDLYEWRAGGNGVRIEKAAFGDLAGAMGAAGFAFMKNTSPT
jgi:glucokinase